MYHSKKSDTSYIAIAQYRGIDGKTNKEGKVWLYDSQSCLM